MDIIDPITYVKYSINSDKGKQLLRKYINNFHIGGSKGAGKHDEPPKITLYTFIRTPFKELPEDVRKTIKNYDEFFETEHEVIRSNILLIQDMLEEFRDNNQTLLIGDEGEARYNGHGNGVLRLFEFIINHELIDNDLIQLLKNEVRWFSEQIDSDIKDTLGDGDSKYIDLDIQEVNTPPEGSDPDKWVQNYRNTLANPTFTQIIKNNIQNKYNIITMGIAHVNNNIIENNTRVVPITYHLDINNIDYRFLQFKLEQGNIQDEYIFNNEKYEYTNIVKFHNMMYMTYIVDNLFS
jgi:hypothetical protein